ncbi:MAG: hypothetical protein QN120_05120 [Armatimonadota bacterium]|nr:hypothetical protein [Armatimonadota bacterium]
MRLHADGVVVKYYQPRRRAVVHVYLTDGEWDKRTAGLGLYSRPVLRKPVR